jgi:hypothetical protein
MCKLCCGFVIVVRDIVLVYIILSVVDIRESGDKASLGSDTNRRLTEQTKAEDLDGGAVEELLFGWFEG